MNAPIAPDVLELARAEEKRRPVALGVFYGLLASTIGGTFLAFSRAGLTQSGLDTPEIAFLRLGVAGLVLLPWLILNFDKYRAQLTVYDTILYTVLIGPPFVVIGISGYYYAPLVHGAVFLPGSLLVFGTAIAAFWFREKIDRLTWISVGVICFGFFLIAAPGFANAGPEILFGDLLFLWAGAQWSLFAVLVGKRGNDPVLAVGALSVLALITYCPLYLLMFGTEFLTSVSTNTLLLNALIHGLMTGVIAVVCYSLCIGILGPAQASLFPALVPALALIIGIPMTGEWLTALEWLAVAVIGAGLLMSVRVWDRIGEVRQAVRQRIG